MIGGGVTPEGTNIQRFLPRTIDEDQWQSAESRDVLAVDRIRRRRRMPEAASRAPKRQKPRVNIIGPIYGTFNMPSDLAEIRRLIEGIGCEVNMAFPLGSHLADVAAAADADVNICMYREFGRMLCEALDRPYLQAPIGLHSTTKFLRTLGELLGLDPEPFIEREKHTTIKPIWDLWRSVTQDFFGTASFAIVANETYARGVRHFLEDEMGLPCTFAISRNARREARQRGGAPGGARRSRRWCMFGSYNERMYLAETGARCDRTFPASFPAPSSAAHRHAVHGLCGRHLHRAGILQRAVRCAVPHPAARHRHSTGSRRRRRGCTQRDCRLGRRGAGLLDELVETEPFLVRISAAKRLRDRAERDARAQAKSASPSRVSRARSLRGGARA